MVTTNGINTRSSDVNMQECCLQELYTLTANVLSVICIQKSVHTCSWSLEHTRGYTSTASVGYHTNYTLCTRAIHNGMLWESQLVQISGHSNHMHLHYTK